MSFSKSSRTYRTKTTLCIAYLIVFSYFLDLYRRGSESQPVMVARIIQAECSISSLGAFLQSVRVGVVERFSINELIMSCKSSGASLRVPYLLIKKWFAFGTLQLLDRTRLVQCWVSS